MLSYGLNGGPMTQNDDLQSVVYEFWERSQRCVNIFMEEF